jgi:eukaryotic-like serine/threonine-protein kinase
MMALSAAGIAQMSKLLDQALPLDAAARERWLEQLAPEHQHLEPVLRQSLLPQDDASSGLVGLDTLPKIGAAGAAAASGLEPGERVGPYQLVRPLGAGGMGEVWLAQRAEGDFQREVALKLPMLSLRRRDLAQRFTRERAILASLEHVNIARLYEAGVSPDGLPYLAMEYVPGEPLTAWCDARRLGLRERIKLFLQVLDAVQYAHARQVIHRDLKPSNILVTPAGQVRLLDFGVAKLLADQHEQHTQITQLYGRALTPEYASPELLRGDPVDIVSDIYSLGVMLYELLTGGRPYRIKAGASVMTQLEQAIATARIEPPSAQLAHEAGPARATTQHKLAGRLRGDLDAIVLKALSVAPRQRYASAAALADDLQRHLSGEPVEARADRLMYRAGKFVLRHGTATSAAAALAILVAVGPVLSRAPMAVPPDAGASTSRVSDKSIAVLAFVDLSEKKDQEYFADGMAEEIFDRLAKVRELHVPARTSSFYFKGKQATIADISHVLGVAYLVQGSVRKAGDHLRISAQLVRADNSYLVWSETYDRNLDDLFKAQDEIASAVVQALKTSLLAEAVLKPAGNGNTDAYAGPAGRSIAPAGRGLPHTSA